MIDGNEAPAASVSERVQLTVATVQVQPAPFMPVAVMPGGSVSCTVVVPDACTVPTLLTPSV